MSEKRVNLLENCCIFCNIRKGNAVFACEKLYKIQLFDYLGAWTQRDLEQATF